jgi:hypothetical protein
MSFKIIRLSDVAYIIRQKIGVEFISFVNNGQFLNN